MQRPVGEQRPNAQPDAPSQASSSQASPSQAAPDRGPLDLLISGGRIVTPDGVIEGDLGVRAGTIVSVGPSALSSPAKQQVDARGLFVLPGGVDVHCHIEQMSGMGQWNADTFETATRSAAYGGTTSLISFAAQASGQGLAETVEDYAARAKRGAEVDHAFHITVTDTGVPAFDAELAALIAAGHRSIKVFTTYNIQLSDAQILHVLSQAKAEGALVCVHAENDAIIAQAKAKLLAQGQHHPRNHARSRPPLAEIEAVERLCRFAEHLDQPVMLFHISTAEAVAVIRAAKARGVPVWAETCPHYLLMTADVLDRPGLEGAKWMCSPPQRSPADQDALWQGLSDGTISLVSSDHAPYRYDASGKLAAGPEADFSQIANGLPGLETRLPLLFDALVSEQRLGDDLDRNLMTFARLTSTEPARLYGLKNKGALVPGMDADITLWDPLETHDYGDDDLHDNVGYNPWVGRRVRGWPSAVFLRGEALLSHHKGFDSQPGRGRWIDRPALGLNPAPANGTSGTRP